MTAALLTLNLRSMATYLTTSPHFLSSSRFLR
jgi:hypothetical protein